MFHDIEPHGHRVSGVASDFSTEAVVSADTHDTPVQYRTGGYVDPLDDVFGSPPPSPTAQLRSLPLAVEATSDPSDIPRLRNTHVTNGYREGIAVSRESQVQVGFDEGYSLGAEIGLQIGYCLGSLEGLCYALRASREERGAPGKSVDYCSLLSALRRAQQELKVQVLFDQQYFGNDGIWLYPVPDREADPLRKHIMFSDVAAAHPVVRKWRATIAAMLQITGTHANVQ